MEMPMLGNRLESLENDLIHDGLHSKWEPPVKNLDKFFTSMYMYYNQKGLPSIILAQTCSVISLGFTVAFSTFLIAFVKWDILVTCKDEESCQDIHYYIRKSPYENSNIFISILLTSYLILFCSFWIFKCYSALHIVSSAFAMEKFYREKLGVRLNDLYSLRWHEIVQRLIMLHEHGIHRVAIKEKLNEHDIVLRIMRKENYMIALINKQVLNMRIPWWISPFIAEKLFLTKSLEWSISFCILEYMFNEQFNVSQHFIKDAFGLKRRFVIVGIMHLLLLPFMLVFMSIHFFLQNAQAFHSEKAYLGPRQFSPLALWTFREFNELPHFFEARVNQAYKPANDYLSLFHNPQTVTVARCTSYIAGSFIAAFLLISFLGEGVLLYVHIGDHNLLWYLGIFSAIFAATRSFVPELNKPKLKESHEELMNHVSAYTHLFPIHWENKSHTLGVRDEFADLFPYKINLFLMEVLSVLLTPLILCFSLPHSSSAILNFIRENSSYVEGVGAVCVFSLFQIEKFGDENYGAPVSNNVDILDNGKLEQSFLNFQQAYPNWEGNTAGKVMVDRIHAFRKSVENQKEEEQIQILQNSFMAVVNRSNMKLSSNELDNKNRETANKMPAGLNQGLWNPRRYTLEVINDDNNPLLANSTTSINPLVIDNSMDMFMAEPRSKYETHNNIPSILRSIMKQENIDYENDFYWQNKFQQQRRKDPISLEKSLQRSNLSTSVDV